MNRLSHRVAALESRGAVGHPSRFFWIIYDPKATDQLEDDFVNAEQERLGITDDDRLFVTRFVSARAADGGGR